MKMDQPRYLAVKILNRVYKGAYSNIELNNAIDHHPMKNNDKGLLTRIVYGTLQHRLTLQYDLKPFLNRPKGLQQWLIILLETALYQMIYLSRIPNYAILKESIQIAKQRGNQGARRLVTGVLHNVLRKGVPDVNYSVPVWLVKALKHQVGPDKTTQILESVNQPGQLSVRVNTASVAESAEFKRGLITIQDQSASLPVESMNVQPNEKVLDACSAPGGKTCQIAERLNLKDGGTVDALDLHRNRLNRVIKNAERLHVDNVIRTKAIDARKVGQVYKDKSFDQILVDAPCSGLGLIRNKPEIRYFKSIDDVDRLHRIQAKILSAVAPKVKVNGTVTYSTCTIMNQENQDTIKAFLKRHPNFEVVRTKIHHPVHGHKQFTYLKLYPDDFKSDGFFVCTLKRVK
ncbi:MAG: 16S rRNA (cytosine(967)-C(5))-methyltransferase RsmB [Acetilactobacillus jinshanensis]